jgi:hypothetical protein
MNSQTNTLKMRSSEADMLRVHDVQISRFNWFSNVWLENKLRMI